MHSSLEIILASGVRMMRRCVESGTTENSILSPDPLPFFCGIRLGLIRHTTSLGGWEQETTSCRSNFLVDTATPSASASPKMCHKVVCVLNKSVHRTTIFLSFLFWSVG